MAITFPDAVTSSSASIDADDPSYSHTVTSGTTLLIVAIGMKANEDTTSVSWNGNTMTEIAQIDEGSISTQHAELSIWGLLSPTAATGVVAIDGDSLFNNFYWSAALNVHGGATADLESAITLNSSDLNNAVETTDVAHDSSGSTGNKLLIIGQGMGDNTSPWGNTSSFTDRLNTNTGGGSNAAADASMYMATRNAPSAFAGSMGASAANVSGLFEIFAAGGALNTNIVVPTGPTR